MNALILALFVIVATAGYVTSVQPETKEFSPVFYNPYRFKRDNSVQNPKEVKSAKYAGKDTTQVKEKSAKSPSEDILKTKARATRQIYEEESGDGARKVKRADAPAKRKDKRKGGGSGGIVQFIWNVIAAICNFIRSFLGGGKK